MHILLNTTKQLTFMAHKYEVSPKDWRIYVQTDNGKNLGNEPYLVYQKPCGEEEKKMYKKGDFYSAKLYSVAPDLRYHILYKDTGKVDLKDGKDYQINAFKMVQKVSHDTCIMHKQPLIQTIKEGKTIGKIMCPKNGTTFSNDDLANIDEPTILVTPHLDCVIKNPNIVGVIYTTYHSGAFCHHIVQLRHRTNVCGIVYESEITDKLISMDGRNVELKIKDNQIDFNETDKQGKPIKFKPIDIPKLKPCDKILTSKEYSSDIIGAKAVNLRRLEEMKEQGKIDVIIPKSIALSHGYVQKMFDENPTQEENFNKYKYSYTCKEAADILYEEEYCRERMNNITKALYDNGIIKDEDIMVRSAFNGEDLPNYSAAGIYKTQEAFVNDTRYFYECIMKVAQSKWEDDAKFSRKTHNIPEENIQIGVLLQQKIEPEYKFTLYTDDGKGNLKIDLYRKKDSIYMKTVNPHVFTYNKETGELTYDSIQLEYPVGEFNENQELERIESVENDLSDNKKILDQIKKVAENAVAVEKEFGHPQDIEGGIKGHDIYFWQTRNIVTP